MARRLDAQQLQLDVERQSKPAAQTRPSQQAKPAPSTRRHPPAKVLLDTPGALLNRSHLRELGLERRAVDAVFRALPVVALPGYSRPLIRVADYIAFLERCTYDGRTRVR